MGEREGSETKGIGVREGGDKEGWVRENGGRVMKRRGMRYPSPRFCRRRTVACRSCWHRLAVVYHNHGASERGVVYHNHGATMVRAGAREGTSEA